MTKISTADVGKIIFTLDSRERGIVKGVSTFTTNKCVCAFFYGNLNHYRWLELNEFIFVDDKLTSADINNIVDLIKL